jgi:hypothetical protein
MLTPADLYLRLHDDGSVAVGTTPARRAGALLCAILVLAAVPVTWASADVLGIAAPKAAFASSGDDDDSGPGGGDDDDHDDTGDTRTGTATRSNDATNTDGNTGVSTKPETVTQSRDDTQTKNTGVSTKPQTDTQSRDDTQTKNTGVSTNGSH